MSTRKARGRGERPRASRAGACGAGELDQAHPAHHLDPQVRRALADLDLDGVDAALQRAAGLLGAREAHLEDAVTGDLAVDRLHDLLALEDADLGDLRARRGVDDRVDAGPA